MPTDPNSNYSTGVSDAVSLRESEHMHCFSHKAMATIFELIIEHHDAELAAAAAAEAFRLLDGLELDLSRFIANSDVTRINKLRRGEKTVVSMETFNCLQQSLDLYNFTLGAFDITAGKQIDLLRQNNFQPHSPDDRTEKNGRDVLHRHLFELDEPNFAVRKLTNQEIELDLGGIGKGFAIDQMAVLLTDWGISTAFLHGGRSSIFGISAPVTNSLGWPVTLSQPGGENRIIGKLDLKNRSISGSGLQRGSHIIDPRNGTSFSNHIASWVQAPDATTSDALATAFMILDLPKIEKICRSSSVISAMIITGPGKPPLIFGAFGLIEEKN